MGDGAMGNGSMAGAIARPLTVALLTTTADRAAWDAMAIAHPQTHFMQSWAWSSFKAREGYQVARLALIDADRAIVGGCLVLAYGGRGPTWLLSPGGPLLPVGWEAEAIALLSESLAALAQDWGAIGWRIEPQVAADPRPAWLSGFQRSPADLVPVETVVVDLDQPAPDRLAAMKPKGRYNLRLSQRHGVTVDFAADPQIMPLFYDLFWQTVQRHQFFGEPYRCFLNLAQTLMPAGLLEVAIARWQGRPLVAAAIVYWGTTATYLYGGRVDDAPPVMAAYALHWAAMERARSRGCRHYDFYGYTRDPHHGYAKFSQFKGQFGGRVVQQVGAHDRLFYDRLAATVLELLQHWHADSIDPQEITP